MKKMKTIKMMMMVVVLGILVIGMSATNSEAYRYILHNDAFYNVTAFIQTATSRGNDRGLNIPARIQPYSAGELADQVDRCYWTCDADGLTLSMSHPHDPDVLFTMKGIEIGSRCAACYDMDFTLSRIDLPDGFKFALCMDNTSHCVYRFCSSDMHTCND